MKKISQILWGIVLVTLGLIWGLNELGITNINIFFDGWWTLFIIIPSAISFFNPRSDNKVSSLICMIIGVLLLLASLDIFDFDLVWKIFWPLVVVGVGLSLIFGKKDDDVSNKIKSIEKDDKDCENITVTFGEQIINKSGEKFKKAILNAIFGSLKINLSDAELGKETLINASAIFGGIEIIVPDGYGVKVKSTSIFGGVTNEKKNSDGKKTIYIETFSLFGGVEIK